MPTFDWTIIIAGYGAILSTIVFLWQVLSPYLRKGKFHLTGYIGNIVDSRGEVSEEQYLSLTILNKGKQNIIFDSLGISYKEKEQHALIQSIYVRANTTFAPAQKITIPIKISFLVSKGKIAKSVWVKDTRGKQYNMKGLKKIINDLKDK